AAVLQIAFFDAFGIPFYVSVFTTIGLIWLYTYRGGIKTIVWTDTLQTLSLLLAVIISIVVISSHLEMDGFEMVSLVANSEMSDIFVWDWRSGQNFFKMFIAGIFITIAMNGLDQNIMQKNLTCRNQKEAKKNIFWFSLSFFISNLFFLALGVLIYFYAFEKNISIPSSSDELYPLLAMNYFGALTGIVFMIGIIAAAFSSADSALTALTTSFCIDILDLPSKPRWNQNKVRFWVHIGFTFTIFFTIIIFDQINDKSVVSAVFKAAGFTYGPLLGLFTFGLSNNYSVRDKWVPLICILSPFISYIFDQNSESWLGGYRFGFEILLINAAITYIGLLAVTERNNKYPLKNLNSSRG